MPLVSLDFAIYARYSNIIYPVFCLALALRLTSVQIQVISEKIASLLPWLGTMHLQTTQPHECFSCSNVGHECANKQIQNYLFLCQCSTQAQSVTKLCQEECAGLLSNSNSNSGSECGVSSHSQDNYDSHTQASQERGCECVKKNYCVRNFRRGDINYERTSERRGNNDVIDDNEGVRTVESVVVLQLCNKSTTASGHKGQENFHQQDNFTTSRYVKMMFNDFCESTGLHGWKYLTKVTRLGSKV